LVSEFVVAMILPRLSVSPSEAQCDEQTARGDERDHVADAGEQDLPGARAPADIPR
jgi:hypothetical protein